jgi:hypothetical protein
MSGVLARAPGAASRPPGLGQFSAGIHDIEDDSTDN